MTWQRETIVHSVDLSPYLDKQPKQAIYHKHARLISVSRDLGFENISRACPCCFSIILLGIVMFHRIVYVLIAFVSP